MAEFLLAVAALFVANCVLNVLLDFLAGKHPATLEWGSILAFTLVGAVLFLIWQWNGVLGLLALVTGWGIVGNLMEKGGRGTASQRPPASPTMPTAAPPASSPAPHSAELTHDEFLEKTRAKEVLWGVRGFFRPVLLVLGPGGLLRVLAFTLLLLAPALGFGLYCVWSAHYTELVWMLPIALAFLMSRPDPNAIELCLWVICALIGQVCATFFGPVHLVAGLLPGLAWFCFCALKGTTMVAMREHLHESPETYETLRESGILIISG